jgi:hypothetical protein
MALLFMIMTWPAIRIAAATVFFEAAKSRKDSAPSFKKSQSAGMVLCRGQGTDALVGCGTTQAPDDPVS